jgi:hypothetical protein
MRGAFVDQGRLFSYISPEARVPANHPLRKIRELVRDVLRELNRSLSRLYRPSRSGDSKLLGKADDLLAHRAVRFRSGPPSSYLPAVIGFWSHEGVWGLSLSLLPRFGALGSSIRAAQPFAGKRPIRTDVHHGDDGSTVHQVRHRHDAVVDELTNADNPAVVPIELEGSRRGQRNIQNAAAAVRSAFDVGAIDLVRADEPDFRVTGGLER